MSEHGQTPEAQNGSTAATQLIVEACTHAVDKYRSGDISKAQAVLDVATQLVGAEPQQLGDAYDSTPIQSYLAMLDEIDRSHRVESGSRAGGHGEHEERTEGAGREGSSRNGTPRLSQPSAQDRSRASSEDADEPRSKRAKVDPSSYAWAATDFILEATLDPSIARTLELIRIYGDDLTQARRDLSASASVPEFPEAEWTNILTGRAVDLDHVFAGRYTSGPDEKITERIGELEFSYRAPVPSKKVGCFGDWVYAWKRASVATAYAFPHRREELDAYGEQVIGLFGALAPAIHSRVMDFDRAISDSNTSTLVARMSMGSKRPRSPAPPEEDDEGRVAAARKRHAGATTARTAAPTRPANAVSITPAPDAELRSIRSANALRARSAAHDSIAQPAFLRGLVWDDLGAPARRFADVSLTHAPVPEVPKAVREDAVVNATLRAHPHLFKIVTPINVERFEELLQAHPNQAFVRSVTRSLREGFWPYADAKPDEYPDTWDERRPAPQDETAASFLRNQRDEEISLDRYSCAFGPALLPGMYSMPVHVVPKPHSSKFRLVNDQSAGLFSLNSMIRPEAIKGAVLDGIPALGSALRRARTRDSSDFIMWKSDVSQAYRRMPVAPHWQIRQVVTIDGFRHVDRCNLFGGRGSLRVWAAFDSLVSWIAQHAAGVEKFNYVDDDFGFARVGDVEWYPPYQRYFPTPQARLLSLWDELGVPHEQPKQLHGLVLPVIGFEVDPNAMTVTLPSEGRERLVAAIDDFCVLTAGNRRRSLAEFQAFTGYANWAFNVYPLLKPALSNVYEKMSGKVDRRAGIYVNAAVVRDLQWLKKHVLRAPGVHLLDAKPGTRQTLIKARSATNSPSLTPPASAPTNTIFFFEALAICAAVHRARAWRRAGRFVKRFAILSDNSNSVAIFNTLRASPRYNGILKSAIDVMVDCGVDVRVDHIPGTLNVIADALSRGRLDFVREHVPNITLLPLIPPQDALGPVAS
ncbi:hypothetical protein C2E23DRAFT_900451 [Lenzites betulinus]|nr:hypothetical protein C2E23DRAFT_900451 [Lenzites betulinus]